MTAGKCSLIAALIFALLQFPANSIAEDLEDFAQIYVDQYFAPPPNAGLSMAAENKAEALAHYTVGRMQENREKTDEAIASYLKVLELQPNQLMLARKCALLLASRAGKQARARELLESTLERNPGLALPYIMLSEFLSTYHSNNQDNKDRALALAKEAVDLFPKDPMTYEHLGKLYLFGKRKDDAKDLLKGALSVENSNPDFWIRLGKMATRIWPPRFGVEDSDKDLAILNEFYSRATANAGSNDSVSERSADFYMATQQFDEAQKIYESLVKRNTDRLDLRKKLARVYKEKGDLEGYTRTLLGIVEINPGDVLTHRQIAAAYREQGDIPNSVKHERLALKIGKGSSKDYLKVARAMVAENLHEEAVQFIKEAAYLFPESPEFPWLLTFSLRRLEKYKEAAKYFEICEKIAKKHRPELLDEQFYFGYATSVERDGDFDRAAKLFKKTIELLGKQNPEKEDKVFTAQVYNYLGYMWLENDMNVDEAGELIKTAIDLDPDSAAITDSLGWFYYKKGRYEEAKKELLRSEVLLEEEGGEPDAVILDHIAQTFYALGEKEKAIDYMKRAVKMEPDKKEYGERLAQYQGGSVPAVSPVEPAGAKPGA
ncbi:MAG: hypothetical protein P1V20_12805 [Verrucomicrobiales bacterium]|nr:hypothetical protein [Verrucomicrobiales bacterium]